MDRFPTPPDPPEDVASCPTCKVFCYPEELIPEGCARCGGRSVICEYSFIYKTHTLTFLVERVRKA